MECYVPPAEMRELAGSMYTINFWDRALGLLLVALI